MNDNQSIHGTAVAIGDDAVLIMGASGSGKSDLALRLIDRGAKLIADDYIAIKGDGNSPILVQTEHHIDAIEIRGLGIIEMKCVNNIALKLIIQLSDNYERMPAPLPLISIGPYNIPSLKIAALEASTPIKIEQALIHLKSLTNMANQH